MTKRPAFQFYPADWRKDNALRACSIGARGLWIELCVVMHDCTPYGHLTESDGSPMPDEDAARLCGVDFREFRTLLAILERKGVSSRTADGVLFSRRMVRDEATRAARAAGGEAGAAFGILGKEAGSKGGRPRKSTPVKTGEIKPPLNPPPSSSSSSSSSSALQNPQAKPIATGVASRPPDAGRTVPAWESYAAAYRQRYGVDPVRNRTTNAHFAAFLERVGIDEAPAIAAHFVRSNRALYASAKHATNLLVRDAEALRTEWATRTHGTETAARQGDRTSAVGNVFAKLIDEAEAGGRDGTHG